MQNPTPPGPPLQEFHGKLEVSQNKLFLLINNTEKKKALYVLIMNDARRKEALALKDKNVKVTGRLYPGKGPPGGPGQIEPSTIRVEKIEEDMKNQLLDNLVKSGALVCYDYVKVYEEPGTEMRTTEKLVLTFPTGDKLEIETFCSGCMENTNLLFRGKYRQPFEPRD